MQCRFDAILVCKNWSHLAKRRSICTSFFVHDDMLSEAGMCRYRYKYYEKTEEVALRDLGISPNSKI